jgi:hypothetical protein
MEAVPAVEPALVEVVEKAVDGLDLVEGASATEDGGEAELEVEEEAAGLVAVLEEKEEERQAVKDAEKEEERQAVKDAPVLASVAAEEGAEEAAEEGAEEVVGLAGPSLSKACPSRTGKVTTEPGVDIYFEVYGEGPEKILLVMGLGTSAIAWLPTVRAWLS